MVDSLDLIHAYLVNRFFVTCSGRGIDSFLIHVQFAVIFSSVLCLEIVVSNNTVPSLCDTI